MATPEKKEEAPKVTPLFKMPQCSEATTTLDPDEYGPMVTIAVGSAQNTRKFYTYKGLLGHYSTYFKAALKDEWREGASRTVELKDDNPEVFKAFFHWIYTGKLYFALDASGSIPLGSRLICEIYVFGDARGVPGLCNAAINLLVQQMQHTKAFPLINLAYVYGNTLSKSHLRKVLVDWAVCTSAFNMLLDPVRRPGVMILYPKEFLGDLVVAFLTLESTPMPTTRNKGDWLAYIKPLMCTRYHDHSSPA